jgi:hypothetical protein
MGVFSFLSLQRASSVVRRLLSEFLDSRDAALGVVWLRAPDAFPDASADVNGRHCP